MKLVFVILCLSLGLFGVRSFGADVAGDGPGRKGEGSMEGAAAECGEGKACLRVMHPGAMDMSTRGEALKPRMPGSDSPAPKPEAATCRRKGSRLGGDLLGLGRCP
ncbi:MAG: hypothetical protein IPK04_19065 [Bdellovibrionales bacterium]|nr:hypothetical protein [Bdellovibrionales bacterium]